MKSLLVSFLLLTGTSFAQDMEIVDVLDNMRSQGNKEAAEKWLIENFDLMEDPGSWNGCITHSEEEGQYAVCDDGIFLFFTMPEKIEIFGNQLSSRYGVPQLNGVESVYGDHAVMTIEDDGNHYLFFSFE